MPAYSASLGCANAKYIYNPDQTIYSIPIGAKADHSVDIRGGAYGTLLLTQGSADAQDIQLEMTLRTDNKALLDSVSMQYPTPEDVQDGIDIVSFGSSPRRLEGEVESQFLRKLGYGML